MKTLNRILNKDELQIMCDIGLLEYVEDRTSIYRTYYINEKLFEEAINERMTDRKVNTKLMDAWKIFPWMIRKNWENTGLFKESCEIVTDLTNYKNSRLLNKEEIDKLESIGILKRNRLGSYFHIKVSESINTKYMAGKKVRDIYGQWRICPWMIKKNWKKTSIFDKQ